MIKEKELAAIEAVKHIKDNMHPATMKKQVGKRLPYPELGRIKIKHPHMVDKKGGIKLLAEYHIRYKANDIQDQQVFNNRW